jgi:N-acetylmuramoyl-L-alanine amidase
MPWSKVPSKWASQAFRSWVPEVWSVRPWWDFPFVASLLIALSLSFPSAAQQPPPPSPPPPAPAPSPRFVVVLDAAHGGDDTGAHLDSGQFEKSANLALNVRLRSLLTARGIQVITTRESDASVDLNRRAELANHANAAVCLSLHTSENGSGVHLFASSIAPAQPSRFLAWKSAQAPWITRSLALAGAVNSALTHAGFNVTLGRIPLPGIESMTCPALAIEIGPVRDSDNTIAAEPDNPDYQTRVAASLAAAVLEWRSDPSRTEARQP